MAASDKFNYDDKVRIIYDCPLKGLEGELAYVSEDSEQVEVLITQMVTVERDCTSYYRGLAEDIEKVED